MGLSDASFHGTSLSCSIRAPPYSFFVKASLPFAPTSLFPFAFPSYRQPFSCFLSIFLKTYIYTAFVCVCEHAFLYLHRWCCAVYLTPFIILSLKHYVLRAIHVTWQTKSTASNWHNDSKVCSLLILKPVLFQRWAPRWSSTPPSPTKWLCN